MASSGTISLMMLSLHMLISALHAPFQRAPAHRALCLRCPSPIAATPAPLSQPLPEGAAIELWHKGLLHTGNFCGQLTGSSALQVQLASGELIKIDGGQVVDTWPADSDSMPTTLADWQHLQMEAAELLADLPPHMLDLRPVWLKLINEKGRGKRVDSQSVAAALFAFGASPLTTPQRPPRQLASQRGSVPTPPSWLAQRLAAAQLLGEERTMFKRQTGQVSAAPDAPGEYILTGGGFKALPKAQANSRAEVALLGAMQKRIRGEEAAWAPSMLPLLSELEMVALGLGSSSKPVARIMSELGVLTDQNGARDLLLRTGQWRPAMAKEAEEAEEAMESAELGKVAGAPRISRFVDPFPAEALAAAQEAATAMSMRRARYMRLPPPSPPDDGRNSRQQELWTPFRLPLSTGVCTIEPEENDLGGRVDLRERCPRVYAIDAERTEFRDDAISYDAETGQLMVHIADLASVVLPGSVLDEVARLRLQSIYASAMPLHMLPPALLQSVCLSATEPNECLTALLQLDAFGRVRQGRIIRSIVPPVRVLTFSQIDELLEDYSIDSQVHDELRQVAAIALRRAQAKGRGSGNGSTVVRWRGVRDGAVRPELVLKTASRTLVDEALGMFSYAARVTTRRLNLLRLPQTEHQRIGTAPLRRYSDLVAQRQLASALCGDPGMPASEVAAVERWIKQRQSDLQQALQRTEQPQMLRALESQCARQASASQRGFAVLEATVVRPARRSGGQGGRGSLLEVRLVAGGMLASAYTQTATHVRRAEQLKVGQKVRVRLRSVDARRGLVDVELL